MIDLQRYLPAAQQAQAVINQVLDSRPGTSSEYIQGWVLRGTPQKDVIFYAVLDASRIPQPEPFARATHQISSALGGQRVYWDNSTGFRFAVLLTPAKRLPRQIDLPMNLPVGRAMIGVRPDGQTAGGKWGDLKHIIVVGYTGSGKSVTTRSLVYQAIRQDFNLILADLDGTTFPMLAEHPSLLAPLANTTDEFIEVLRRELGELEHRASLYKRAANYPEKIEEYNQWAVANGQEPLKRVLVALDEFNWGMIQCYFLEKQRFLVGGGVTQSDAITAHERQLAERALRETDGKISRDVLEGWGMRHQEARRLHDDWKVRGWAANDQQRANGLYMTPKLVELLTSRPARPTRPKQPSQPTFTTRRHTDD